MRQATESARKRFFCSAGVAILILLLYVLINTLWRDWLIIMFGMRVYPYIRLAIEAILLISLVTLASLTFSFIKIANAQKRLMEQEQRQKQEQERREAKFFKEYADDSASPELTRKMLEEIRDGTPEMDMLVDECRNHMDAMDIQQKKQSILIKTNKATYLDNTVEVMNRTETQLCKDIRQIINLCITTEKSERDMEAINKLLNDAGSRVNDAKQLLKLSGEWVNSRNKKDGRNDGSEVKLWIETMRETLKEG